MELKLDSPDAALTRWIMASRLINGILVQCSSTDGVRLTLDTLVALAAAPASLLEIAARAGFFRSFYIILRLLSRDLCLVLVPTDAAALEAMLPYTSQCLPDAEDILKRLITAAKSPDGLEQRQRRRLELLGGLPAGVCANLLCSCSTALPPTKLNRMVSSGWSLTSSLWQQCGLRETLSWPLMHLFPPFH